MFEITADEEYSWVEFWSERRLQLRTKPETAAAKVALRKAVRSLRARPGHMLGAVLTSDARDLVDAENVLLFNVGTGNFAAAAAEGLRFERTYHAPARRGHQHRYQIVSRCAASELWRRGDTSVVFSGVIPVVSEESKPHEVWLAVRRQVPTAPRHIGFYGLAVTLTTPFPVKMAAVTKPLLDGIVAGLHAHNGTDLWLVSARLAAKLALSTQEVASLLTEPAAGVLGIRTLLRRHGVGIKWNPGDDECVSCTLLNSVQPHRKQWLLGFELFAVSEMPPTKVQ